MNFTEPMYPPQVNPGNHNAIPDSERIAKHCYFMRSDANLHTVVYGQVLSDPVDGEVDSICYAEGYEPFRTHSRVQDMKHLLSVEQFVVARKFKWPSNPLGIGIVFGVPSN